LSLVWLACCLFVSTSSFASLGGDESSVSADLSRFQGHIQNSQTSAYRLHEIETPAGIAVREYVAPSGTVFAVAWKGPFMPDLKQLLGTHYAEYQQALQSSSHPAHGPVAIRVQNLVVELSGHMRGFSGRAYLVDQVPADVSVESIH
jgi:hypothetical protein